MQAVILVTDDVAEHVWPDFTPQVLERLGRIIKWGNEGYSGIWVPASPTIVDVGNS